ncbi:MAG TPA: cupin domain-containing protein, partial [Burkholderiaceae bacterium]
VDDASLEPDVPLKILSRFEPDQEWVLEPGDMLYLPPGWAHDGVAEGECLTGSIGFRAAGPDEVAQQVLQRLLDAAAADDASDDEDSKAVRLYRDPHQPAADAPGRIPQALQAFAADAVMRLAADRAALDCGLGEWLSEPAAGVSFDRVIDPALESSRDAKPDLRALDGVELDRRTRMLYDERFVFINGESFRAGGRDATVMRRLADRRCLYAADLRRLGDDARALLHDWLAAGWLHAMRLEGDYA